MSVISPYVIMRPAATQAMQSGPIRPAIIPSQPPHPGQAWLNSLQPYTPGQTMPAQQASNYPALPPNALNAYYTRLRPVAPTQFTPSYFPLVTPNPLKTLFQKKEAVIYALFPRTFGAVDKNGDGIISPQLGENGTFLSMIPRLDELKEMGVNVIHLLPVQPVGQTKRLGEAGSAYAPSDYRSLNPEFYTPVPGQTILDQARIFINECHRRGIYVMADIPSCASFDLANAHPELIAKDMYGKTKTPYSWIDILMFENNQTLQNYYEGYFDLMANQVGVDGFRADVARARTETFWKHFIDKYPDKAWLAETYIEEDASPLQNIPRDIPETLLKAGFDSIYGQDHIFPFMENATTFYNYLLDGYDMFQRTGHEKSFIGSFLTHDDPSIFERGGVILSNLCSGLMSTIPWTNPYILDGFTTGYNKPFDIFNYRPRPQGEHPEIGVFLKQMLGLRKAFDPVITQGTFTPLAVLNNPQDQIIAFTRQYEGKTLLIVANKDINERQTGTIDLPGYKPDYMSVSNPFQPLQNLAPEYGEPSQFIARTGQVQVSLGPGRFHVFEINLPDLGPIRKTYL